MEGTTTIQVKRETKKLLNSLKLIKQEPYDEVIKRVIDKLLDTCEEGSDRKTKELIEGRIKEIEDGKVISTKDLRLKLFGG